MWGEQQTPSQTKDHKSAGAGVANQHSTAQHAAAGCALGGWHTDWMQSATAARQGKAKQGKARQGQLLGVKGAAHTPNIDSEVVAVAFNRRAVGVWDLQPRPKPDAHHCNWRK